jgi:hypothetical protein
MTTDIFFVFICKTDKSKPVKQEVNDTVMLPPLVFPPEANDIHLVAEDDLLHVVAAAGEKLLEGLLHRRGPRSRQSGADDDHRVALDMLVDVVDVVVVVVDEVLVVVVVVDHFGGVDYRRLQS